MAEKLYRPEELEPSRFMGKGEISLDGLQLSARAIEIGAVTGREQFQLLWDLREEIPEDWELFWGLLVPDGGTSLVRVLRWFHIHHRWYHFEFSLDYYFHEYDRMLLPREWS